MFHRLTVPSYFGGLPGGYDVINDPTHPSVAGSGVAAFADGMKTGGPNDGTYFVAFGDDATSEQANRPHKALAENTDFIDNLLHDDLAVPTYVDKTGIVGTTVTIDTVADLGGMPVFVGPPGTPNSAAGLAPYFRITDPSNDDQVTGNPTNTQVVVSSVSPGGAVGTFYTGVLTLTLNVVPPNSSVRVHLGKRSSLYDMGPESLVLSGIRASQERQAGLLRFINDLARQATATYGTDLIGSRYSAFTGSAVTGAGAGGLGASITTLTTALQAVDAAVIRRRAFTAVHTDNASSLGGDIDGASADSMVDGSLNGGGRWVRRGSYEISATPTNWVSRTWLFGEPYSSTGPDIHLAAARASDLLINDLVELHNIRLFSDSATARYRVTPAASTAGLIMRNGAYDAGTLAWFGSTNGGHLVLEDVHQLANGGFTGAAASLEITQEGRATIRRCSFGNPLAGYPNAYFHDIVNDSLSSLTVEDCDFTAGAQTQHALRLQDVDVPITFRNCKFKNPWALAGTGYAMYADGCQRIIFENCTFESETGHAARATDCGVRFVKCRFISGTTAGLATLPMLTAYGHVSAAEVEGLEAVFEQCVAVIGASSLRGSGAAATTAVIELGGLGGTALGGVTRVDGLFITYDAAVTLGHNNTTVLLHGYSGASEMNVNSYENVTFDNRAIDYTGAGTLGGKYTAPYPAIMDVGGGGYNRSSCKVDNLAVVNVKNPSSTHTRHVLYVTRCNAHDVKVDGASPSGAGNYSKPLVEVGEARVEGLSVGRQYGISCSSTAYVKIGGHAEVSGFFRATATQDPSSGWVHLSTNYSKLCEFTVYLTAAAASTGQPLLLGESGNSYQDVVNCKFVVDGDPGINDIIQLLADETTFTGNTVRWNRAANQMLNSTGNRSIVDGNKFLSVGAGAPTISVTGTGSVTGDNVLAASASSINPS